MNSAPGLNALLQGVTRRDFDMIAAWSVDRLASLKDLIAFLDELKEKHVDRYLRQQAVDPAEFEQALNVDRVRAGSKYRAKGTRLGRPPIATGTVQRVRASV